MTLDDAFLFASAIACHAFRGERHPKLRYGLSTVVDGVDTSVHDVLGFSKEAVQSGRAVTVLCNCANAKVSPPLTIPVNDAAGSGDSGSLYQVRGSSR